MLVGEAGERKNRCRWRKRRKKNDSAEDWLLDRKEEHLFCWNKRKGENHLPEIQKRPTTEKDMATHSPSTRAAGQDTTLLSNYSTNRIYSMDQLRIKTNLGLNPDFNTQQLSSLGKVTQHFWSSVFQPVHGLMTLDRHLSQDSYMITHVTFIYVHMFITHVHIWSHSSPWQVPST